MKKLLLTACASLLSTVAFAANPVVDSPNNHPYLGIRGSFDLSIPGSYHVGNASVDIFENGPGVGLVLVYNIPLVTNLYIEPGIDLYYNTCGIDLGDDDWDDDWDDDDWDDWDDWDDDDAPGFLKWRNHSLRKFGMRVPVQLGYHFDFTNMFKFHIFTGPVLNLGFSNDYYLTSEEVAGIRYHESGSMYSEDNGLFQMNRFDCAWRVGVGFNVQDIFIGFSGDMGMVNLVRHNHDGKLKYRENAFHFTLGYNF